MTELVTLHKGYLVKQGQKRRNWKQRFFALTYHGPGRDIYGHFKKPELSYYIEDPDGPNSKVKQPKGIIDVTKIVEITEPTDENFLNVPEIHFSCVIVLPKRKFILGALDKHTLMIWIAFLDDTSRTIQLPYSIQPEIQEIQQLISTNSLVIPDEPISQKKAFNKKRNRKAAQSVFLTLQNDLSGQSKSPNFTPTFAVHKTKTIKSPRVRVNLKLPLKSKQKQNSKTNTKPAKPQYDPKWPFAAAPTPDTLQVIPGYFDSERKFIPFSEEITQPSDNKPPAELVRGATIHQLISRLTSPLFSDGELLTIFLNTYHQFIQPPILFSYLVSRFDVPLPEYLKIAQRYANNPTSFPAPKNKNQQLNYEKMKKAFFHWENSVQMPIQFRLVNFLREWITKNPQDFLSSVQLRKAAWEFCSRKLNTPLLGQSAGLIRKFLLHRNLVLLDSPEAQKLGERAIGDIIQTPMPEISDFKLSFDQVAQLEKKLPKPPLTVAWEALRAKEAQQAYQLGENKRKNLLSTQISIQDRIKAALTPTHHINSIGEDIPGSRSTNSNQSLSKPSPVGMLSPGSTNRRLLTTMQLETSIAVLKDFTPLQVAEQLTLIDHTILSSIRPYELMKQAWSKKDRERLAPNICKMISRFDTTAHWVATEILDESTEKKRGGLIKFFIQVALHLKELNNLNGVMCIVSGLGNSAISRLGYSWNFVPDSYLDILEELETLSSTSASYQLYRKTLAEIPKNQAAVPFLGIYLTDLTFIDDGNPDKIAGTDMIFIEKLRLMTKVVLQIRDFQERSYLSSPQVGDDGQLVVVPEEKVSVPSVDDDLSDTPMDESSDPVSPLSSHQKSKFSVFKSVAKNAVSSVSASVSAATSTTASASTKLVSKRQRSKYLFPNLVLQEYLLYRPIVMDDEEHYQTSLEHEPRDD